MLTGKTFIKGETMVIGSTHATVVSKGSDQSREYKPQPIFSTTDFANPKPPETKFDSKEKKKRSIDELKEEIKKNQEERARKLKKEDDLHDETVTTNLYLSNLAPQITEQILWREFGQFGGIQSVKIMWPRSDEEKRKNLPLIGFVNFAERKPAEKAKEFLQGHSLLGFELRLAWAKQQQQQQQQQPPFLPPFLPLPIPTHHSLPLGGDITVPLASSPPKVASTTTLSASNAASTLTSETVEVKFPPNIEVRNVIDWFALFVSHSGLLALEIVLAEREKHNPLFAFLQNPNSSEFQYYRWRLYSFLQGETCDKWRVIPFQMTLGGPLWIPPPLPPSLLPTGDNTTLSSTASTRAPRESAARFPPLVFSPTEETQFHTLLTELTLDRESIKTAMVFALEHAFAAEKIIQMIANSFALTSTHTANNPPPPLPLTNATPATAGVNESFATSPTTPLPLSSQLARLYLMSDILHNSSARIPNAAMYRSCLQSKLPSAFEKMGEIYKHHTTGRITAQNLKEQITRLLKIWQQWSVYSNEYTNQLHRLFFYGSSPPTKEEDEDIDGYPWDPSQETEPIHFPFW